MDKNETLVKPKRTFLEIVPGTDILIEALDGKRTIASAEKVFTSFISPDFRRWKIDNPEAPTSAMNFKAFNLVGDYKLAEIFRPFGSSERTKMTQAQIVRFCEKYPQLVLPVEGSTLLPFVSNNHPYVAIVKRYNDGLLIFPRHQMDEDVYCGSKYKYLVILPQDAIL